MNKLREIKVSYNRKIADRLKIQNAEDAYKILLSNWNKRTLELQEEFKVLIMNNSNEVVGVYPMSKGGITGTVVDLRLLFGVALKCCATGIILAHNHPSGSLKASEADINLTNKIKNCSDFLDVKLLDHLIITKNGFYSLANEGYI